MSVSIKIPNLAKFQKALNKAPELAGREIKKALAKSALQIVRETKPLTPRDTGLLMGSIGKAGSQGGILEIKKTKAIVGTRVKYAVYVHEGFQRHGKGQRKFLEVGAKKAEKKIQGFFKDAIDNVFKKIAMQSK